MIKKHSDFRIIFKFCFLKAKIGFEYVIYMFNIVTYFTYVIYGFLKRVREFFIHYSIYEKMCNSVLTLWVYMP